MKKILKAVIDILGGLAVLVALLMFMTNLLERKDSNYKYDDFFEQKEDFDVLFFGSSHVINGIYPMELWNDYGIVSYNFGGHMNKIPTSYWVMENALEYTNPKLVVVDCMLYGEYKQPDAISKMHISFDAFPLSLTKIRGLIDLYDDPARNEAISEGKIVDEEIGTFSENVWNYVAYHSKWNEITEKNFSSYGQNKEKGAESRINVEPYEKDNKIELSENIKADESLTSIKYLIKMIESCQKKGIDILLIYIPYGAEDEEQQKEANQIYDLAQRYNVNYINFIDEDVINTLTDSYDFGHLNPSGARKVTNYLGQYICDNYNIDDQRKNPRYEEWYNDYNEYICLKNENIVDEGTLETYLMLMSGDELEYTIDINDRSLLDNKIFINLLQNLGVENVNDDTDFIIAKSDNLITLNNFRESGSLAETNIGDIHYYSNEEGAYGLYLFGEEMISPSLGSNVSIKVYRDGEMIDDKEFDVMINDENRIITVYSNSNME